MIAISNNNLTKISSVSVLDSLKQLNLLNVEGNQLQNVREIIQYSKSVIELNLNGNYVGKLTESIFENHTQLERLYLKGTNLSVEDLSPFNLLKKLLLLDISFNNLENVNFKKSKVFSNLKDIYAVNCKIKNIPEFLKHFGQSLNVLDLSENMLGNINSTIFGHFTELEALILRNTTLAFDDLNPFSQHITLRALDISYNSFENVDLNSILQHLHDLQISIIAQHYEII